MEEGIWVKYIESFSVFSRGVFLLSLPGIIQRVKRLVPIRVPAWTGLYCTITCWQIFDEPVLKWEYPTKEGKNNLSVRLNDLYSKRKPEVLEWLHQAEYD
jgi:hypothetical protein